MKTPDSLAPAVLASRESAEGDQGRDPGVDAHDGGAGRERLDRALAQQRHEPAAGRIAADGHRGRLGAVRQRPGPHHGQRPSHLRQVQPAVVVPERGPGVLRRGAGFLPRLEPGVAGLGVPEPGECGLEVPQGLLERDARHLVEVAEVTGPFPLGQQRGGLEVGHAFVPLLPRCRAGFEREVVDLADAAEGPGQFGRLFRGRVEAVLICPLHHLLHIEHISGNLCRDAARHAEGRERRFLPGLKAGVSTPQLR